MAGHAGRVREGIPCRLRSLVRGLKPLVVIIAFTGILNIFFTPDTHYLWEWGIKCISEKGIENALFMVVRIMLLVMGTFFDDLHHQPHPADGRTGIPAGAPERSMSPFTSWP